MAHTLVHKNLQRTRLHHVREPLQGRQHRHLQAQMIAVGGHFNQVL